MVKKNTHVDTSPSYTDSLQEIACKLTFKTTLVVIQFLNEKSSPNLPHVTNQKTVDKGYFYISNHDSLKLEFILYPFLCQFKKYVQNYQVQAEVNIHVCQ